MQRTLALSIAVACMGCLQCTTTEDSGARSLNNDTVRESLDRVASARIYFGHQSVGNNVLEGLRELSKGGASQPAIIESSANAGAPVILHAAIGRNTDPASKIAAFRDAASALDSFDIAMMKLCYIDITATTDADALFALYCEAVDSIRQAGRACRLSISLLR